MSNKQFIEDNYNLIHAVVNIVGSNLSVEDKEDLVQDTVIKILESDKDIQRPSAFINQVVRRLLMNKVRDSTTDCMGHVSSLDQPSHKEDDDMYTLYDIIPASRTDDNDQYSETANPFTLYKDDIDSLCVHLTPDRAKLFKMRYYLGMTPKEIAKELDMDNKAVRMTLLRAVKDARVLTETVPSVSGKWDGLSFREMCLAHLPDDILFPFKLYYTNSKSMMDIIKLTGISFDGVKRAISLGERMIHERYGLDVRKRR